LLGQPDENALGASDVAEPIHVFVLDHFVDELRAVLAKPGQRATRSLYEGAGFNYLRPKGKRNCVMRRVVS
jgi:hypothetical protein